jgi:hypothetical protein
LSGVEKFKVQGSKFKVKDQESIAILASTGLPEVMDDGLEEF